MTRTATPNRGRKMSDAEFKRLWLDPTIPAWRIGEMLGITRHGVSHRAESRGLPKRKGGGGMSIKATATAILPMWLANVSSDDIGRHFGCDGSKIRGRMAQAGHKRPRRKCLPLTEWYARQLAARMAQAAAVTQAAMRDAEMLDKVSGRPRKVAA